jgi:L-asparaginase
LGRCRADVSVRTLMMIDSLDMTDADRSVIVQNCRHCHESRIIVTHGTDTMELTARALGEGCEGVCACCSDTVLLAPPCIS